MNLAFLRTIGNGEEVEYPSLAGFGPTSNDYEIRIENRITGAGVRITCDQPLYRLASGHALQLSVRNRISKLK